MKILSSKQLHEADAYTILNEPISSIDLMERAAKQFVSILLSHSDAHSEFCIVCGLGNNGGDGLAIARMLNANGYKVSVFVINNNGKQSEDFVTNHNRLKQTEVPITEITQPAQNLPISAKAIIIDALFGSGLNRPLSDLALSVVKHLNALQNRKVAVDIPSGLFAEKPLDADATVFQADETITFQSPKLQFLFAENEQYVGNLYIANIGQLTNFAEKEVPYEYLSYQDIHLKKRTNFGHKGTFGHALLVSGSYGKMGAAVLASKACVKTGCGLLTTHVPQCGYEIIQIAIPEVMADVDANFYMTTRFPDSEKFSAIGIGPGIGTDAKTTQAFATFLQSNEKPLVLDADALNILAAKPELWKCIKPNTIITPHPGEFDRLTRKHTTCYERFATQIEFAQTHTCIVVLKGHHTTIAFPTGTCAFNSTGNSGMATGGSGDTLTGIVLSLLAQQYSPAEAAKIGVFLHGLAGDIATETIMEESLIASDIIENITNGLRKITILSK